MTTFNALALSMSTLVLTGTVTNIYLSSRPVSYERCMLDNMRGQDRSVYGLSSEICLKQSHLTITLPVRKTAVGLGADYRYLSTDRRPRPTRRGGGSLRRSRDRTDADRFEINGLDRSDALRLHRDAIPDPVSRGPEPPSSPGSPTSSTDALRRRQS